MVSQVIQNTKLMSQKILINVWQVVIQMIMNIKGKALITHALQHVSLDNMKMHIYVMIVQEDIIYIMINTMKNV